VKHALAVQRALALGNYHAFFELYLNAPNMGGYIIDHFVDRERLRALLVMTRACVHQALPILADH
jgi:SAC3 family protein LENG8/THP3